MLFKNYHLGNSKKWKFQTVALYIIRLRVEGITVGNHNSPKAKRNGAAKFVILQEVLESLLEDEFLVKEISNLLGVSERTIYRRMSEYGFTLLYYDEMIMRDLLNGKGVS